LRTADSTFTGLTGIAPGDSVDPGSCGHTVTADFYDDYYAISVARLLQLLEEAGFAQPRRLDDIYFQPLPTARRSGTAAGGGPSI